MSTSSPLVALSLACAALAAAILVWYLVRRPPLGWSTKVILLFGIAVLPIATATTGNVVGYEETKTRSFCGGCHVMEPFTDDAASPTSLTLAARHSRNAGFGEESCYTCHADYGMFGAVATKLNGLRHVYHYYTSYRSLSLAEALPRIDLYEPFPNQTCMHCHSTRVPTWEQIGDHAALADEVRAGEVSCASPGCHGAAHPTTGEGTP